MRSAWFLGPVGVGVFAVSLALAPGSAGARASTPARAHTFNLSTAQGIDQYLRSIGVNPSKAIHQTGSKNYAGPNCPGTGWNCTSSSNAAVVQQASPNGVNVFTCTPAGAGTNAATDTCVVVQTASSGDNNALCRETATNTAPSPSCSITQTNSTGKNSVTVDQEWAQTSGDSQIAGETANVTQTNSTGPNVAKLQQVIAQRISDAAATQDQEATQFACVQQDSPSGTNNAVIRQSVTQGEQDSSSAGTAQYQNQNAGPGGACGNVSTVILPNLAALVQQDQGSGADTGKNSTSVQQSLKQKQVSTPTTGTVFQQQGNTGDIGGLEGDLEQTSTGVATATADQNENQYQDAETVNSLSQNQYDPARCCTNQQSNPNDKLTLTQEMVQAADAGANQFYDVTGECVSSGTCSVTQTVTNNTFGPSTCTTNPCIQTNEASGGAVIGAKT